VSAKKALDYAVIAVVTVVQIVVWLKGGVLFGGDQAFFLDSFVPPSNYLISIEYAIERSYPFLLGPINAVPSIWYDGLAFVFDSLRWHYSEYVLFSLLFFMGSLFTFKLVEVTSPIRLSSLKLRIPTLVLSTVAFMDNWGLYFANYQQMEPNFPLPGVVVLSQLNYVFLPVMVYFILKLFSSQSLVDKLSYLGLLVVVFAVSGGLGNIAYLVQLFGVVLLASVGFLIIYKRRENLAFAITLPAVFLASNVYWMFSVLSFVNQTLSSESFVSGSFGILNSTSKPFPLVFSTLYNPPSYLYFIALVALLGLGMYLARKSKFVIMWFLIYIAVTTFYAGTKSPFGAQVEYLFFKVPYFVDIRTEPWALGWVQGFFFSLIVSSLVPLLVDEVKWNWAKLIAPLAVLSVLIFSIAPSAYGVHYSSIHPPQQFVEAVDYLNSQPGEFNVIALPQSFTWMTTTWYEGNNILVFSLSHPVFVGGHYGNANDYESYAFSEICDALQVYNQPNDMLLYNLFYVMGIKYVFLQGDATLGPNVSTILSELMNYEQHGLLKLVGDFPPCYVFEVNYVRPSLFYGSNYSNFSLSFLSSNNVSNYLFPLKYKEINPSEYVVYNNGSFKYVFFNYAYNDLWLANASHFQFLYGNGYVVNGKGLVVKNEEYLTQGKYYAIMAITLFVGVALALTKFTPWARRGKLKA
jgi:hypothetical protein